MIQGDSWTCAADILRQALVAVECQIDQPEHIKRGQDGAAETQSVENVMPSGEGARQDGVLGKETG